MMAEVLPWASTTRSAHQKKPSCASRRVELLGAFYPGPGNPAAGTGATQPRWSTVEGCGFRPSLFEPWR